MAFLLWYVNLLYCHIKHTRYNFSITFLNWSIYLRFNSSRLPKYTKRGSVLFFFVFCWEFLLVMVNLAVKTQQFDVSDSSKEASHWSTPFAGCENLRCLLLPVKFQTIEFLTLQNISTFHGAITDLHKFFFVWYLIFVSNRVCSIKTPLDKTPSNCFLEIMFGQLRSLMIKYEESPPW